MLVLISPPTAAPNEHAVIDALFRHGLLQRFHLRKKPEWSDAEIARFVDRVGSYRDRIVLHTARPTLAAELGLAVCATPVCAMRFHRVCHAVPPACRFISAA